MNFHFRKPPDWLDSSQKRNSAQEEIGNRIERTQNILLFLFPFLAYIWGWLLLLASTVGPKSWAVQLTNNYWYHCSCSTAGSTFWPDGLPPQRSCQIKLFPRTPATLQFVKYKQHQLTPSSHKSLKFWKSKVNRCDRKIASSDLLVD